MAAGVPDSLPVLALNVAQAGLFMMANVSASPSLSAATNVGGYANIVISVSDGKTSTSLTAFNITVQQVVTGSATISWTPPTQNTDGTALTNLAGYRITYGTSQNALTQTVQVPTVGVTSYTVDNLTQGTWYFAMKSYTTTGTESALSTLASKTIQ